MICSTVPMRAMACGRPDRARPTWCGEALERPGSVVGDLHEEGETLQLEVAETIAGRLLHPREPLVVMLGRGGGDRLGTDVTGGQAGVEPDDVRLPAGDAEDPPAAATDDDRRVWPLDGHGLPDGTGHPVMGPFEGGRTRLPQRLHDAEPLGSSGRRVPPGDHTRSPTARSRTSANRRRGRTRRVRPTKGRGWRSPWPRPPGGDSRCRRRANPPEGGGGLGRHTSAPPAGAN